MPYKQITVPEALANRVTSMQNTLRDHYRTSMAVRGRPSGATKALARQFVQAAESYAQDWPDDERLNSRARKIREYAEQFDLLDEAQG